MRAPLCQFQPGCNVCWRDKALYTGLEGEIQPTITVCLLVGMWYDAGWGDCSLVPRPPPSHEEKRSGEPSRISWASGRFSDSVT